MFDLGIQELIVIFIVALIVFGPKRLPELGRTLGKGIMELKKAVQGVKEQMDAEIEEVHKPIKDSQESIQSVINQESRIEDMESGLTTDDSRLMTDNRDDNTTEGVEKDIPGDGKETAGLRNKGEEEKA